MREETPDDQVIELAGVVHQRAIGALHVFVTAPLRWLYDGYVAACARFQAAEDARREASDTFIAVFEALNWAASIELFMKEQRTEPLKDDLVHAFGLVRNRVLREARVRPTRPADM